MSARIRYEATELANVLVSVRLYSTNDGSTSYRIKLKTDSLEYFVEDMTQATVISQGRGPSLSRLKIRAKEALAALGVVFNDEKRKPRSPTPAA